MMVNGDQLVKNRMVQQNMAKITFSLPDQVGLEIAFECEMFI